MRKLGALVLAVVMLASNTAAAGTNGAYRHEMVAGRIQVDVPDHWTVQDRDTNANISALAEAVSGQKSNGPADLVVKSQPEPFGGMIRVSLKPGEGISQAELVNEIKANLDQFNRDLQAVVDEQMRQLDVAMSKVGSRILGRAQAKVATVDGKLAIVMAYRRTSANNGDVFKVTQYHIHMGDKTAVITLSVRERDSMMWQLIMDKVLSSIRIS